MPAIAASQPNVDLGVATSFAVLAGTTITNTGITTIRGDIGGDVGLYPGTAFTGQTEITVSGSIHLADAIAQQAKVDLVLAYDYTASRTTTNRIPSELGGITLTPGTYDSADGTFQITGTLTLDAQGDSDGVFIFKTASTLITASNSNVNLINVANSHHIFWQVGSSATLGTNSQISGHIIALTSITANTGTMVQGQLLARNGAVTLDSNTIINGISAAIEETTPAAIEETTPAAIEETTPAAIEETTPAAIEETTPAAIEETRPAVIEETTPAALEETTPAAIEETTPAAIEETRPAAIEETTPAALEETSSAQIVKTAMDIQSIAFIHKSDLINTIFIRYKLLPSGNLAKFETNFSFFRNAYTLHSITVNFSAIEQSQLSTKNVAISLGNNKLINGIYNTKAIKIPASIIESTTENDYIGKLMTESHSIC